MRTKLKTFYIFLCLIFTPLYLFKAQDKIDKEIVYKIKIELEDGKYNLRAKIYTFRDGNISQEVVIEDFRLIG